MGRRKDGDAALPRAGGDGTVADFGGMALRTGGRRGAQHAGGVVVGDGGFHVAAGTAIGIHRHAEAGIVEVSGIGLSGGKGGDLLHQAAGGKEAVVQGAGENAHGEPVE